MFYFAINACCVGSCCQLVHLLVNLALCVERIVWSDPYRSFTQLHIAVSTGESVFASIVQNFVPDYLAASSVNTVITEHGLRIKG